MNEWTAWENFGKPTDGNDYELLRSHQQEFGYGLCQINIYEIIYIIRKSINIFNLEFVEIRFILKLANRKRKKIGREVNRPLFIK